MSDDVTLGEITVPSGTALIFDCGALALVRAGRIPAVQEVRLEGMEAHAPLPVLARAVGTGDFANLWHHIRVVVRGGGSAVRSEWAGDVIVDYARLLFADASIAEHWIHDETIDGLADFVFWGWGDGVFPVFRELDADGRLVALRVQLHTRDSDVAMRYVNGMPPAS